MPQDALAGLAALAGWSRDEFAGVAFENADPVLRSRFRLGNAGAAALAACGIAAARLQGSKQDIAIDVRHAAASLRSGHYLKLDGPAPSDPIERVTGFYPTRDDRWVYLHCNFPHHRAGHLRLLGAEPDRDAIAAKTRFWQAQALEDAMAEAGLPGGMARTAEEWALHGHSHALAALPALEVLRIGDAPAEKLPRGARPLSGVRVLDLTRVIAGPTGARTLAEHGADVLKITSPNLPDSGFLEFDTGHGKRAAFLDLDGQDGQKRLRTLIGDADVFCQSYRPGSLAARGFGPDDVARLRPGIVYVTLSAFSHAGPWSARRGFDTVVQTVSGIALAQSEAPKPALVPASALDYVSGYLMAFGTLLALKRRHDEGGSWLVRASLAQTGRWITSQGRLPAGAADAVPADFDKAELERWLTHSQSPLGRLTHLAPALRMSATPPRWERPAVPLGHHDASWASE